MKFTGEVIMSSVEKYKLVSGNRTYKVFESEDNYYLQISQIKQTHNEDDQPEHISQLTGITFSKDNYCQFIQKEFARLVGEGKIPVEL